jgi:3-phenylpropionate/trans-cinnamate dioxygenase ferredoxin reductase subunit
VHLRGGKVVALDCVNDVKDYAHGKALVQSECRVSKEKLADRSIPLKSLAE